MNSSAVKRGDSTGGYWSESLPPYNNRIAFETTAEETVTAICVQRLKTIQCREMDDEHVPVKAVTISPSRGQHLSDGVYFFSIDGHPFQLLMWTEKKVHADSAPQSGYESDSASREALSSLWDNPRFGSHIMVDDYEIHTTECLAVRNPPVDQDARMTIKVTMTIIQPDGLQREVKVIGPSILDAETNGRSATSFLHYQLSPGSLARDHRGDSSGFFS